MDASIHQADCLPIINLSSFAMFVVQKMHEINASTKPDYHRPPQGYKLSVYHTLHVRDCLHLCDSKQHAM